MNGMDKRTVALALLACLLAVGGCSSGQRAGRQNVSKPAWVEIGAADGLDAGEGAAWDYWNAMVEQYDGAFASLITRSSPEIDPARARFTEWAVLESTSGEALVEEGIWVLEEPRLVPYGTKGFAEELAVRYLPIPESGDLLKRKRPREYEDAYAHAWETAYTATLHEREIALEKWIEDRFAIYQADMLIANGKVVEPKVDRQQQTVPHEPNRKAERREIWVLSGGVFSLGSKSR